MTEFPDSVAVQTGQLMDYSPLVLDHFNRPRNVADNGSVGRRGHAVDAASGSAIEFVIEVEESASGPVVRRMAFRALGCPHTIAVASWLTDFLPGQSTAAARNLDLDAIATELALPVEKWHCVLTAEDAVGMALMEV